MNEVEALAGKAALIDGEIAAENAPPEAAGPVVVPVDPSEEARGVIAFAVELFTPIYPCLSRICAPERQGRLAVAAVPLMDKYGFTMGSFFEKWGPEINFLLVAGPLVVEVRSAVREERAAAEKAANEQQSAQ